MIKELDTDENLKYAVLKVEGTGYRRHRSDPPNKKRKKTTDLGSVSIMNVSEYYSLNASGDCLVKEKTAENCCVQWEKRTPQIHPESLPLSEPHPHHRPTKMRLVNPGGNTPPSNPNSEHSDPDSKSKAIDAHHHDLSLPSSLGFPLKDGKFSESDFSAFMSSEDGGFPDSFTNDLTEEFGTVPCELPFDLLTTINDLPLSRESAYQFIPLDRNSMYDDYDDSDDVINNNRGVSRLMPGGGCQTVESSKGLKFAAEVSELQQKQQQEWEQRREQEREQLQQGEERELEGAQQKQEENPKRERKWNLSYHRSFSMGAAADFGGVVERQNHSYDIQVHIIEVCLCVYLCIRLCTCLRLHDCVYVFVYVGMFLCMCFYLCV